MTKLFLYAVFFLIIVSCTSEPSLIQNRERLANIQEMLAVQKQLTANSAVDLWSVFDHTLSGDEKQAMEFLYAYMPLSDLADYSGEFFLANIRASLRAREELTWGKSVPEDLFLHFVLPVRINNENLDAFRIVMYDELKARVRDLDIEKAALEVNHWCHEKVVYRGTDSRTSAPLSAMRKAFGRCGEESTFAVSALRTVGIPARQVYTPRWAHSDDNHAWVEVWVNGTWKFLGACEPDPRLNMGWFTEPARRTLLVHTRAYGNYFGDEEALVSEKRFSELNLTSNYAPVKKIHAEVLNEDGSPAKDAKVEFQLYNYADFYPIATQFTNGQGQTAISLGLGEIIVWASQDDRFAFKKISVSETDTVRLTLGNPSMDGNYLEFDFVPPHLIKDTLTVTQAEKDLNERRLAEEDSIRGCYTATFKTDGWSKNLAKELRLDENEVIRAIQNSYGNWEELEKYLHANADEKWVLALLKGISAKDFSDTKAAVLSSHLRGTENEGRYPEAIFTDYVLAPRIKNEMLLAWRPFLRDAFAGQKEQFRNDPQALTRWIAEHIEINDVANLHSRAPIGPEAVYKLRVSDTSSREIFFVAVCRSPGIPARLNPATREPEYYAGGEWYRAAFSKKTTAVPETGALVLKNGNNTIDPQYEIHFSIAKRIGGNYRQLEYPFAKNINGFGSLTLETGDYYLITGNRLEDGSVLSSVEFFTVKAGNTKQITVNLRQSSQIPEPLAQIDLSSLLLATTEGGDAVSLSELAKGKNIVLALLDPDKEPSKHILNDLADYIDHFEAWPGQFLFMAAEDRPQLNRVLASYKLPANRISGSDRNNMLLKALTDAFGDDIRNKLPLVILCNSEGQVFMFSSGYKIGIGEQLLKIIPALSAFPGDACCRP